MWWHKMKIELKIVDNSGKVWIGETKLNISGKSKSKQTSVNCSKKPTNNKKTLSYRIIALKEASNYFKKPKTPEEVRTELKLQGFYHDIDIIRMTLLRTVRKRTLRRITEKNGKKNIYKYVNP